jgi:hypothetical protein
MTVKWLAALIAICVTAAAPAQFRPRAWFTPGADHMAEAVVKALLQRGVKIDAGQVSLLSNITATAPNPTFDVRSIATLDNRSSGQAGGRSAVKLVCHEPSACLPFYAIVLWTAPAAEYVAGASPSTSSDVQKNSVVPNVMHAGVNATMLMEDDRASIQMSVVSLESGPAGRTIRVQSPDRKRTYLAEIVSANTVKGTF